MTRDAAHQLIDSGSLTWGYLKTLLRAEMGAPPSRSKVNPSLSHETSIDILARAIDGLDDDGIVSKSNTPNRDRLMATNILRECA